MMSAFVCKLEREKKEREREGKERLAVLQC